MFGTQNETLKSLEPRAKSGEPKKPSALSPQPSAFTLVELLVVITIIGILAALITGAAINAMNRAKQAAISMEIQQLNGAIDDFKNEYGAYPPNVFSNSFALSNNLLSNNVEKKANARVLLRSLKKSFARSTEFSINLSTAAPNRGIPAASDNAFPIVEQGLTPAEALVFWLQGFSSDIARPLTGTDLKTTSIDFEGNTVNNVVTIETRQPLYEFDRTRLRLSRDSAGNRRFITMTRANGDIIQIQLYEYLASGSQEPFVYFDTSRETPLEVVNTWDTTEFSFASTVSDGVIYPLKQLRADTPDPGDRVTPFLQYVEYANKEKFQILHCGTDDIWGNFSNDPSTGGVGGQLDVSNNDFIPNLLVPEGPFIGDIADTVGNFLTGTLEDEQE